MKTAQIYSMLNHGTCYSCIKIVSVGTIKQYRYCIECKQCICNTCYATEYDMTLKKEYICGDCFKKMK